MARFIFFKLVRLVATLLAVSFLTFMLTALLPGDPVDAILPRPLPATQRLSKRSGRSSISTSRCRCGTEYGSATW